MSILIDSTLLEQPSAISYTELAPQTRTMIKQAHSGQAIIVEEDGEDRAILMDPVDYRLLVAMLAYHTSPVEERQVQNGMRLNIPRRIGPVNLEDARSEVGVALNISFI